MNTPISSNYVSFSGKCPTRKTVENARKFLENSCDVSSLRKKLCDIANKMDSFVPSGNKKQISSTKPKLDTRLGNSIHEVSNPKCVGYSSPIYLTEKNSRY